MKKTLGFLLPMIIVVTGIQAQCQKTKLSVGPEFSLPTLSGINSSGIGAGISVEHFFNRRIAGTVGISYNYFKGNVVDFFKHDTIKGFSVMPLLIGGKYFFADKFYISGAAGLLIGLHNAGNHLALSPGVGLLIPVSATSKLDLGVKLIGVPSGYSFSENSFLNKGGYSFLTCKIAYVF